MFSDNRALWRRVQHSGQIAAQAVVLSSALLLISFTLFSALGWLPWPEIALSLNGHLLESAGMWLQIGLTALMAMLVFFLPANARMARLEAGHRSFAVGMEDVARAYRQSHEADRAGMFGLSSEFDSIRERMEQLRQHPDFAGLEPELLQLAAQMSHETRALAQTYSDAKIARAKSFLQQRQEEIGALTERLRLARLTCDEMRRWLASIEAEENQARIQLRRLEADLREILPGLGYAVDFDELPPDLAADLPDALPAAEKPARDRLAGERLAAGRDIPDLHSDEHAAEGNVVSLPMPAPPRPEPRG